MNSLTLSIKNAKKCAFCKYWYDPTNSAIKPEAPSIGMWKIIDTTKKNTCLKRNNSPMPASAFCSEYECKL